MTNEQPLADDLPRPDGWQKNAQRLLIAMLLCLAALSLIYCLYAIPTGDDFDRSAQARDVGLLKALMERRAEWTGRWTGLGLVMAIGSQVDLFAAYPAILLAFYFATFLGVHLSVCGIAALPARSDRALLLSALLFFAYWTTMPAPGESFYWFTGAANEHLTFILGAIALYLGRHAEGPRAAWAWTGGAVATFALSGVHELYSLMAGYALLLAFVASWRRGGSTRWYYFAMGVVLLIGFAFVATAPGNQLRAEAYAGRAAGQVSPGEVPLSPARIFWRASPNGSPVPRC